MRRVKRITVTSGDAKTNRDFGKTFEITEKPAEETEEWCARALLGIGGGRMDIPEELMNFPSAAIIVIGGARALVSMSFEDAKPLMAEMMACVKLCPDPANPAVVRNLMPGEIEEPATLIAIRKEVLELHLGFTLAEAKSRAEGFIKAIFNSSDIPTSLPLSESPSAKA